MKLKTLAIVFVCIAALTAIGVRHHFVEKTREENAQGWATARQVENQYAQYRHRITVVAIKPEFVQRRSIYDDAIKSLCSDRAYLYECAVGFFLPGDKTPTNLSPLTRWADFKPLAFWSSRNNEFMSWDCSRAGVGGAPPEVLCGLGVGEAYSVVIALGARQGMGDFCHWPQRSDIQTMLLDVLSEMRNFGQYDNMISGYQKALTEVLPRRFTDCNSEHQLMHDTLLDKAITDYRTAIGKRTAKPPP
jgi:hypothetical protein